MMINVFINILISAAIGYAISTLMFKSVKLEIELELAYREMDILNGLIRGLQITEKDQKYEAVYNTMD